MEFKRRTELKGGLGIVEAEEKTIRVLFPNPRAALRVDEALDLWLPWGRRSAQPGDWPEGGWAREESLDKAFWTRWDPVEILVRPARWMEKDAFRASHWFDPAGALRVLSLAKAPGTPLYVVTIPSPPDFASIHPRMPRIVPA